MITITIYQDCDKNFKRLSCKGHAGYAESGSDIICAAVSVLVINTINSLEKFTSCEFEKEKYNEKKGIIDVSFKYPLDDSANLLMKSLILGLQNILDDNTADYVSLFFKEV